MDVYLKNRRLASVKECTGFFSKFRGLMFSKRLRRGEGILLEHSFESRWFTSLHMIFVFFPIDILWLNKHYAVVDVRRDVKPFIPFILPKKKAKYVIELCPNMTNPISLGDILDFRRKTI